MVVKIREVLISDPVDPICAAILERHGLNVTCANRWPKDRLLKEIQNYEALIVRSETKVTAEVLDAAPKLRLVGRAGTGLDNVDITSATIHGVLVMNTPSGNTLSAAEHTCAMIASLSRHIPQACAALKNGVWDRKKYMGNELSGKTLAILGLGRIGREVAVRMQAFGMKTIGYDPMVSKEAAAQFRVDKMELEEIWPLADFITVHTPLIPQTHHLINTATLAKCKPSVRVVNIARGGIIDEEALLAALEAGRCAGAALDVFAEEPPRAGSVSARFAQHPAVVCTPHLGASTVEAQERVAREIAEQLIDLVTGRRAVGVANAPLLGRSMFEDNKPWISLAQALGFLARRLADPIIFNAASDQTQTQVELVSYGEGTEEVELLASAALVGHLSGMTANGVNIVNATVLARERGITWNARHTTRDEVGVVGSGSEELDRMLRLSVTRGSYSLHLTGSVQAGNAVLFAINDSWFPLGATLSGNVALFSGKRIDSTLIQLIGSLAGKTTISAVMCSRQATQDESWLALRTGEVLTDPSQFDGPEAMFVAQLAF